MNSNASAKAISGSSSDSEPIISHKRPRPATLPKASEIESSDSEPIPPRVRRRRILGELSTNLLPPSNQQAATSVWKSHLTSLDSGNTSETSGIPPAAAAPAASTSSNLLSSEPYDVEATILRLFDKLHTHDSAHPIFGPPTAGLLRLPLTSTRKNGQSWSNKAKQIAQWIRDEMGDTVGMNTCWMSRNYQLQFTMTGPDGRPEVLARVLVTRLLAFLVDPTDEKWDWLSATTTRGIDHPFSHSCGRGQKKEGQDAYCINGLEHGRFASRNENESHKLCTYGARALCPGHGLPAVKCIFTHPDGTIKHCLMTEGHVPVCGHEKKCY